jgi:hypothetical protein
MLGSMEMWERFGPEVCAVVAETEELLRVHGVPESEPAHAVEGALAGLAKRMDEEGL